MFLLVAVVVAVEVQQVVLQDCLVVLVVADNVTAAQAV
jgi:hypothetical protein